LILLHCVLDMGLGVDAMHLRRFAPLFVETVEKWREMTTKICAGEDPGPFVFPTPPQGQGGQSQFGGGGLPGQYMKI